MILLFYLLVFISYMVENATFLVLLLWVYFSPKSFCTSKTCLQSWRHIVVQCAFNNLSFYFSSGVAGDGYLPVRIYSIVDWDCDLRSWEGQTELKLFCHCFSIILSTWWRWCTFTPLGDAGVHFTPHLLHLVALLHIFQVPWTSVH